MENDVAVERELEQIQALLVHDEELPLGLVSRLEAAVHRDQTASRSLGWEARLGVTCICFVAFGLWSQAGMGAPLAAALALIALVYPWAALTEPPEQRHRR
jgi:hypothetical protein